MKLEAITSEQSLSGIEASQVVTVVATVPHGRESLQLIYRTPAGAIKERLLSRDDEAAVEIAITECPFAFDGDGAAFQLACEAKRIDLAFLFDPMEAVHRSNVEPLPHQITAVYESLLPRQPLRFVLADDPGAGKTIMAGLYICELIMRADAHRILIVASGSLVEQWREELDEKFGLAFHVYSTLLEQTSPSSNPFEDFPRLIIRLDQLSRNEELREKLCAPGWDLAVFDKAHKLAAHYSGSKLEKTGRFRLAEKLGAHVRHLLLMTATPHNGKEEDFQLFLSLLDADRFYGKFRDGVHKVDASDLMRRMVKEELVKFDGTPLFPERKAYTVNYEISQREAALYEAVTEYVKTEMSKSDQLKGPRKGSVGFALTALQRRLASSPEAIFQSLKRRRDRLENHLRNDKLGGKGHEAFAETLADLPEDDDELTSEAQERLEATLIDDATAARTVAEIEVASSALKGHVFDILGEAFEETSLKDLLMEAIRYGDHPDIRARLTKEIDFWQDRWLKLKEDGEAGKDVRLNLQNVARSIADLSSRLESRKKDLQSMRHVVSGTPMVLGTALIVPAGLMNRLRGEEPVAAVAADAQARARIEQIAMDAVRQAEETRGYRVIDVSADKCGWDLTAYPPESQGKQPSPRHIEVKGRLKGASTVTVTRNEMLYAFNQGDKFVLAIVLLNEDDRVEGPYYIHNPFDREPGWGVASTNYKLGDLLGRAETQ